MKRNTNAEKALLTAFDRGYRISKDGNLINPKGKKLNGSVHNSGYKTFTLSIDGKMFRCFFHQLQAYQKFGDGVFENDVVRHINDIKEDNSFSNIEIGSLSDNQQDIPFEKRKSRLDETRKLSINKIKCFSDDDVLSVWKDRKQNMYTYKELSLKYNSSLSTIKYFFKKSQYVKRVLEENNII